MNLKKIILLVLIFVVLNYVLVTVPVNSGENTVIVEKSLDEIILTPSLPFKKTTVSEMIHFMKPSLGEKEAEEYGRLIKVNCEKYGIDEKWVVAMVWQESRFDANAVSKEGAIGLLQIMPSTAKYYNITAEQLKNPEINIPLGIKYLSYLIDYYGNTRMGIIAYNQGMGNVNRGTYKTWYYEDVKRHYKKISEFVSSNR